MVAGSGGVRMRRYAHLLVVASLCVVLLASCSDDDDTVAESTNTTSVVPEKQYIVDADAVASPPGSPEEDAGVASEPESDENIIGGQPIDIAAVPWTAALVRKGVTPTSEAQFCGGVLVRTDVVMTAAHCVTTPVDAGPIQTSEIDDPGSIEVVLGRTDLDASGGERIGVRSVYVSVRAEQQTDGQTLTVMSGDYALLQLESPSAQPRVKLPRFSTTNQWATNTIAVDVGWGCTRANTPRNEDCTPEPRNVLRGAQLEVQPASTCAAEWGRFDTITELCVVDIQGAQGACNGDSGGPLITRGDDGAWYLLGLNSWGVMGCQPGVPASVAFVPWLMDPAGQSWIDPNELFLVKSTQT